jgi:hypothetical protein
MAQSHHSPSGGFLFFFTTVRLQMYHTKMDSTYKQTGFYSNVDLACELLKSKVHFTVTVLQNIKGKPKQINKNSTLGKHKVGAYGKQIPHISL